MGMVGARLLLIVRTSIDWMNSGMLSTPPSLPARAPALHTDGCRMLVLPINTGLAAVCHGVIFSVSARHAVRVHKASDGSRWTSVSTPEQVPERQQQPHGNVTGQVMWRWAATHVLELLLSSYAQRISEYVMPPCVTSPRPVSGAPPEPFSASELYSRSSANRLQLHVCRLLEIRFRKI